MNEAEKPSPKLEDAFFPVEEWDVNVRIPQADSGEQPPRRQPRQAPRGLSGCHPGVGNLEPLPASENASDFRSPSHRAIVDIERERVFAIVGPEYQLVTNEAAVEMAKGCFCQVFSQHTSDSMDFLRLHMPGTRSFCHIDFGMKDHEFNAFDEWDAWRPFLRVTNSYNRTKALQFDLGFLRSRCTNGMLIETKSARVRRYHTTQDLAPRQLAGVNFEVLKRIESEFLEKLLNLRRYAVPPHLMLALVLKVFDIRASEEMLEKDANKERLAETGYHLLALIEEYFDEMGHNGYAALNVLTDFASRPVGIGFSSAAVVHGLQGRAGRWVDEFASAVARRDFRFEQYVDSHRADADRIHQLIEQDPLLEL